MGVLSALPLVSAGNLCCCLWVTSGGLVAAYLLQQNQSVPMTFSDGALVGLKAGLAGSVVYLFLSIPITIVLMPLQREMLTHVLERFGRMPPEVRDFADSRIGPVVGLFAGFLLMAMAGSVFATLGGVIGAVLFRKPVSPPTDAPQD